MAAIRTTAVVECIRNETDSVYTLVVKTKEPIPFEPGQFFFIHMEREGRKMAKAYSVANVSGSTTLEFCIKRVEGGYASNKLYNVKKGEIIEINGPYGFFVLKEIKRPAVFLATGTGIAALRPMIHTIFAQGTKHDIWLFLGVRTQQDILYKKEFEHLAQKHVNFHFIPVLSKEKWNGAQGHVQQVIWKYVKDQNAEYYICGLFTMVDEAKQMLMMAGIDKERIHFERYT